MSSPHTDSPICPPGSHPSILPTTSLSPSASHITEQIPSQRFDQLIALEEVGVSAETFENLNHKFNRREFNLVVDGKFEDIVLESVRNLVVKHDVYGEKDIEAEVERRLNETMSKLDEDFRNSRPTLLTEIFHVMRNEKPLEFYLIRLLAADNIYDLKSFVAYGMKIVLERFKIKSTEEVENTQADSKTKKTKKTIFVRRPRLQTTFKSSSRLVNVSGPPGSGAAMPHSSEPSLANPRRANSRLAEKHSRRHGIRKACTKTKTR